MPPRPQYVIGIVNISLSDSNRQLTYGHINNVNVVIQKPIEIRVWLC